jgi:TolB-like protein
MLMRRLHSIAILLQPRPRVAMRWAWLAGLSCLAAVSSAHAQKTSQRWLVQRIEAVAVDAALARSVEEAVVLQVGKREGLTVVSPAELEQTVQFAKTAAELGCDQLDQCLVEVQKKLKAERLISGKVSRLGSELVLTLAQLDVANKTVGRRVTRQANDVPGLLATIPQMVSELLGAAPPASAFRLPEGNTLKLAVMPLAARGVPAATADAMTQILSAELNQISGVAVISRDDIRAMLDKVQVEGELGCTDNMACIVEIGAALGLAKLVTGTVGKLADTYVIALQLVDIHKAEVENRVLEAFAGDPDELKHAIKLSAYQLVGVDYQTRAGRVDFAFNVGVAEVRLGTQQLRLRSSQLGVGDLTPGRYSLRVVADPEAYFPLQTDVYVSPSGDNVRSFALREKSGPWYTRWWVWTIAGVAIAGGVTAAIVVANNNTPSTGSGTASIGARMVP